VPLLRSDRALWRAATAWRCHQWRVSEGEFVVGEQADAGPWSSGEGHESTLGAAQVLPFRPTAHTVCELVRWQASKARHLLSRCISTWQ
jgi:hypothetical protein